MSHLKKIIYNCKQATLLVEKRQIQHLTFRETIELRIHLAGCSMCKLYNKQSQIINTMVKQLFYNAMQPGNITLDDDFKKDLQNRIEEELNKN